MFEVMKEQCDQCLFSPNRIVSKARMHEVLKGCAKADTHFICHKASMATPDGLDVCCRGFYDSVSKTRPTQLMRIAMRLRAVEFVEVESPPIPMLAPPEDDSCEVCGDELALDCPHCDGSGEDPSGDGQCEECDGSGTEACPECQ